MKKIGKVLIATLATVFVLAACGGTTTKSEQIAVISREDGSGTRGAFIELFGIEEKDSSGEKVDKTTVDAEITNSTSVMMTNVAGNTAAIGYISLGALNDTVKAVAIDGVEASVEHIKDKSYKIARPFNIATKGDQNDATKDFIAFVLSEKGQAVVEENKYISLETKAFTSNHAVGKVTIVGSSSVSPLMEKLKEAYASVNPQVTIELQQNDSTTGMNAVIDGTANIGMASRELKDTELEKGALPVVIAMDGIAVIVNHENAITKLDSEEVKDIFVGNKTNWDDVSV